MFWTLFVFGVGIRQFVADIHENALQAGKSDKARIEVGGLLRALFQVIPEILKHKRFSTCNENKKRSISHMMVLLSFVSLAIVAGLFGSALHLLDTPGPYSQLNPIKWVANLGGIILIAGSLFMLMERRKKCDQVSTYADWFLLWLLFGLGFTGMLVEITRIADAAFVSYLLYFIHLILAFNLVAFMPFTKLAHMVYRTIALTYDKYIGRY